MVEKDCHFKLKEEAIKLIKRFGYNDDEIFREYPIYPKNNEKNIDKRSGIFADVVAIKNGKIELMIECGDVKQSKLDKLILYGKVIVLPYPKKVNKKGNKYYINKSVSLSSEQIDFVDEQSRFFNLSKFVRYKLTEYIKFIRDNKINLKDMTDKNFDKIKMKNLSEEYSKTESFDNKQFVEDK